MRYRIIIDSIYNADERDLKYSSVVEYYERLEAITGRIEMTQILAALLKETPKNELSILVYLTQGKLRPDYEGVELGVAEKLALRALSMASGLSQDEVRKTYIKLGDIGSAAEKLLGGGRQGTLFAEPLALRKVYDELYAISQLTGDGAIESKLRELVSLLNSATPKEAKYILRAATGVLRLGVADYTMLDACAIAFLNGKEQREPLERAYNVTSDLGYVVELAAEEGLAGIQKVRVQLGKPIRPMLAERLESASEVLEKLGMGKVALEFKLDGERLQIHKRGDDVELFSRRLEKITHNYPDVIELVKNHVKTKNAILEAEVVAINSESGEYLPFQELMHRRRKYGVEDAMKKYPVAINFFDILYANGEEYANRIYAERREKLVHIIEESELARPVPAVVTSSEKRMERYMEEAISEGCEGLVVKDISATYRAGAREFAWIKLKREYRSELTDTIDLVIIGAFHGRGKRAGTYGTYLLSAYDDNKKAFPSITKIGTGFTDEHLEIFPKLLKDYENRVKPANVESNLKPDVWFRPRLVIEVIASEITLSPTHPAGLNSVREGSGLALRFPKFTGRIRDDKRPENATTVKEIINMYKMQLKKIGSGEEPQ
jgi:DNA ligase-1